MSINGKWCSRHNNGKGARLPRSEFSGQSSPYCRKCAAEYQKEYYHQHKENLPPKDHPWIDTSNKTMAIRKHNRIVNRLVEDHYKEIEAKEREIQLLENAITTLTCRRVLRVMERLTKKGVKYVYKSATEETEEPK